jgi:hypothetical protein
MRNIKLSRIILTVILTAGSVSSFILDWRSNHLLSPNWHPHARFHGALLLFFLGGVSATGLWLLWRKSKEPEVAIKVAAFLSVSFWTPLFYITFFLPTATPWAGEAGAEPQISGHIVYPNMLVAGVFLLFTALAWWIGHQDVKTVA